MADAQNTAVPAMTESRKRSRLSLFLIIGVITVVAGAGSFLAWRYLGTAPSASAAASESNPLENVKSVMNLDAFLVNLADTESPRFVKVTFRLGLDKPKLGEEYANDPVILAATRDRIISLLSTKTADELLTLEGKGRLREEIRQRLRGIYPEGNVVEVYIMDFVVQL